jgi:hypothetical protein
MSEGTEEKVVDEKKVEGGESEATKGMNGGERTSPLKAADEKETKDEVIVVEETKSEDKLEIEGEEKEKMVGRGVEVEKKKRALEEAALQASRKRAPTGGIKIPGFLRSTRSKEKKVSQSLHLVNKQKIYRDITNIDQLSEKTKKKLKRKYIF